jgi:hypothetical protein
MQKFGNKSKKAIEKKAENLGLAGLKDYKEIISLREKYSNPTGTKKTTTKKDDDDEDLEDDDDGYLEDSCEDVIEPDLLLPKRESTIEVPSGKKIKDIAEGILIPPIGYHDSPDFDIFLFPKLMGSKLSASYAGPNTLKVELIEDELPDEVIVEFVTALNNIVKNSQEKQTKDVKKSFSVPLKTSQTFEFDYEIDRNLTCFIPTKNLQILYVKKWLTASFETKENKGWDLNQAHEKQINS